jgi:hypothetical protein
MALLVLIVALSYYRLTNRGMIGMKRLGLGAGRSWTKALNNFSGDIYAIGK